MITKSPEKQNPFLQDQPDSSVFYDNFYLMFDDHLLALKSSDIGNSLHKFSCRHSIQFFDHDIRYISDFLDTDILGAYCYNPHSKKPGEILYREGVHVGVLAHELRHAWQHLEVNPRIRHAKSPQDQVVCEHFIEGDARAVQFAVTIQVISEMGLQNKYAQTLISSLPQRQKEICEYRFDKLQEIASSENKLLQAMRDYFDYWNIETISSTYETELAERIRSAKTGKVRRIVVDALRGGRRASECFTSAAADTGYPNRLAETLGRITLNGVEYNYLTQTTGADLSNEIYTKVRNIHVKYVVEKKCKTISP